jgi:cytochrome c-type biogenesis protein CcmE
MNPVRKRRLIFVMLLVLAAVAATALALTALKDNINHYYSPTEISEGQAPLDRTFRLGGLVAMGSTQRDTQSLRVDFKVTDCFRDLPVRYNGILPDLFREGQSVIATGKITDQIFVADEVLAKHDENYMPAEAADALAKARERGADEQCLATADQGRKNGGKP